MPTNTRILPAEWAPQSGVMLTWPHGHGDWAPHLARVTPTFVAIAREVAKREKLLVTCYDESHRAEVQRQLTEGEVAMEQVRLAVAPSNDTWARDHGPITVLEAGQPRLLDFVFNGWGRKHASALDNRLTGRLHDAGVFDEVPLERFDLVLEGGSIDSDGEGTLLTTRRCLLSPERNPQYDCVGLELMFARLFGTRRVLWLDHGELSGDDTDAHVDTLARFCDARTIAHVTCDDPTDPHYEPLARMAEELAGFRDQDGEPYRLVPLPLPAPQYDEEGQRLPATHANFLIIDGAVLVPTYDDPTDALALERLAAAFPDREVVSIDCRSLILQYGSLHCVTMQLPVGVI